MIKKYVFKIIAYGYGSCLEDAFYDALDTLRDEGFIEADNADILSEEDALYMETILK
jgi:hypothetical protein